MFPGRSNWQTFGFDNRLVGRFSPATELEFNRFWPLPFREIMWHLSTQVNGIFLAAYITVNPKSGLELVLHALSGYLHGLSKYYWYPCELGFPSPWSNSVCMHNCPKFLEEYYLEVIQYGCNWDTNKVIASVNYLWVLATPLSMD